MSQRVISHGFFVLVSLLLATVSPSRAATLRGTITDRDSGRPLAFANVQVMGTQLGVSTDSSGRYHLAGVPSGRWTLSVSYLGYSSRSVPFRAAPGDTLDLSLALIPGTLKADEVVYTATRTRQLLKDVPVATELVTLREMRDRAATTVAEALENEIGLDVREDFSGSGIMMQGIDPDKVLILVDGSRVIGRVNGSIDLDQLALNGVRQIEVVKGAVSTLYGSEAIGGVINIITEQPRLPWTFNVDLSGGSYYPSDGRGLKSRLLAPALSAGWHRGRAGVRASLRYRDSGIMDIEPATAHTEGREAVNRLNGELRLDYTLARTATLSLTGRRLDEEKNWVEDSGLVSVQVAYNDRETNRRNDLSAALTCTPGWADRYEVKLYHSNNDHRWEKLTQSSGRLIDFSAGEETYDEASLQATRTFGLRHRVTFGGDLYRWEINTDSQLGVVESHYAADLTASAAYAQDEWTLGERWTLLPGLRFERHEVYGENWSPRLSLMWRPAESLKLRASAGRGYRAPSSKELYFVFNHAAAGYIVFGNPDLRPETSRNLSLSLEHTYKNAAVARVTFYYNDLEDLIDFDSTGISDEYYLGIYQYANITSAWTRGVEVEREFRLLPGLEAKLAYAFLETRNRETGDGLLRRPKHSARWTLSWRRGPWTTTLWGSYTGRTLYQGRETTADQDSDEWTNPYTLWNLSLSRRLGAGMSWYCKAENLLDTTHWRYGPWTGRVVTVGWRWNYPG